jgi:propanol-preferring alcohol dehydrogenase
MRAALLTTPRPAADAPMELTDLGESPLAPDEVSIDVLACGVCRTDLQLCEGDLAARTLPIVPGHQIVGTVIDRGSNVHAIDVGTKVGVAWIAATCGVCRFCRTGRENLCHESRFTGWDRHGGFAERVTACADFVHVLPEGMDPVDAAPLLCGGAIGLRALRVSGIRPGQRLGLYGFGASATCAIQVARHWDCEVYVCTRSSDERERAIRLGAAWTGSYDELPPEPLDAAITFAPSGDVVIQALRALDRGGIVAINAIHLDRIPQFDYHDLWWERQIRSVANVTRSDVRELLQLAVTIPIRTTVTSYSLERANEAITDLASGRVDGAAVLIPRSAS